MTYPPDSIIPDTAFQRLIAHLWRSGVYAYWWYADEQSGTKRSVWFRADDAPAPIMPRETEHSYFGVHPTAVQRGTHGRSTITTIAAINCLFGEFDTTPLETIQRLDPAPNVVIESSPGKYHAYWLLDEPFIIDNDEARQQAKTLQAAWVVWAGSDNGAKDLARVLRVPGTRNVKPEYGPEYPTVQLVAADFDHLHSIDELAAIAQPFTGSEKPAAPTHTNGYHGSEDRYAENAYNALVGELARATEGERNKTLFRVGRRVNEFVQAGRLPDSVFAEIERIAARIGLAEREITRALKSARDGGTAEATGKPTGDPYQNGHRPHNQVEPGEPPRFTQDSGDDPDESNILATLHNLGYTFRLNLVNDVVEVNGEPINDIIAARIRVQMRRARFKGMESIADEYTYDAIQNGYHPIREYLDRLEWDGQDRIRQFAEMFTSPDAPVQYDDGHTEPLHYVYLLRWLVGAVAKAYHNHQNCMLVLAGPQGIGKSQFVRWLASGTPGYHLESPINTSDKDNDVRLMSHFIWEVSELDATTRKADVAALKAFITKHTVVVRKTYGKHDTIKPALCSLVGTVNNASGFLNDETGNRRFYVTTIDDIDWSYTTLPVDQLWAQAVHLYRAGEPWRLLPEETLQQADTNQQHDIETPLEGWLLQLCDFTGNPLDRMTVSQIFDLFQEKEKPIRNTRMEQMELSRVLRKLGATRSKSGAIRYYQGIKVKDVPWDNLWDNVDARNNNKNSPPQGDKCARGTTWDNLMSNKPPGATASASEQENSLLEDRLSQVVPSKEEGDGKPENEGQPVGQPGTTEDNLTDGQLVQQVIALAAVGNERWKELCERIQSQGPYLYAKSEAMKHSDTGAMNDENTS